MTRIALIDGPLAPGRLGCVSLSDVCGDAIFDSPAGQHAIAVATAIRSQAPQAEILSIPVFTGRLSARVSDLVAALRTAGESGADLVHCSLGLARNDEAVAGAIAALEVRIVVASAPARGAPVWPAALRSVISVQGDARCGGGQWSVLNLPTADFGACPRGAGGIPVAGPSIAAAHLTGILARRGIAGTAAARNWLQSAAAFHGRERRTEVG